MLDAADIKLGENDPAIETARRFAREKPSTSYLQRKMKIPYSRAVRLMELLERERVVSARNSAGVRTVLG
jgi:DNA segregation ATPase FtsK/SpoIIIE-like protein